MRHHLKIVTVSGIILGFLFTPLYAGWWDEMRFPVPPDAEVVNTQAQKIAGAPFDFTYYKSSQPTAEIKSFYRSQLPNQGWKEKNLAQQLGQAQSMQVDPAMAQNLDNTLMFEKDGAQAVITLMPQGFSRDGKTLFAVAKGKVEMGKETLDEQDFVPELLTKPKKTIAPVYPGATLINTMGKPPIQQETYHTKDDIESVVSFYKQKMSGEGWYLTKEIPIKKIDYGEFADYDISQHCPTCPKGALVSPKDINTYTGQLDFSNQKGGKLRVVVSQTDTPMVPASFGMTLIVVSYEQKIR